MSSKDFHLCIDIGNTRFKFGVFAQDEMIEFFKCRKKDLATVLDFIYDKYDPSAIIASTTRKKIPELIKNLEEGSKQYIELSDKTPLPIEIDYETPETLGRDRIATAVGANSLFPEVKNIVVDAGTCITYDFIDEKGVFKGGNISPGIRMRLQAMHEHTANLPLVKAEFPDTILGQSTKEALQNGALRGTIYEIDSFIRLTENKYGETKVILTGGDANYFVDFFKSKIFVVQNLVLIGLNKILQHNA